MKPGSIDFFKFHPHTRTHFREGAIDGNLMNLIIRMLSADPANRIQSTQELKKAEFFNQENKNM